MKNSIRISVQRLLSLLLTLACVQAAFVPAIADSATLKTGISCIEALATMVAAAQTQNEEMIENSTKILGSATSIDVDHFRLIATAQADGTAGSVTIAADYLDGDIAKSMGTIFGLILRYLGGMAEEDLPVILASIDFNAFNTLETNKQTLIYDGNKIIVSVLPDDDYPYQLTLALPNADASAAAQVNKVDEAYQILQAMHAETSAIFSYDEKTDLNKLLGTEHKYYSKVNFALSSIDANAQTNANLSVNQGGSIEVFSSSQDAINRQQDILNKLYTFFGEAEYSMVCGTALLRLSEDIAPAELGKLVAAFVAVCTGSDFEPYEQAGVSGLAVEPEVTVAQVEIGETVKFGSYEQDNNTSNGKEPIEWIVIAKSDNTAMLVSTYALDVYNTYWGSSTWDKSTLRTWMNETFYQQAFSEAEKASIVLSNVEAEKNPNYSTHPGTDTQDWVFALSYDQAKNLLSNSQRRCKPTAYAAKKQSVYTDGTGNCYWWLRSPGKPGCGAAIVCTDGSFDYDASYDAFCYGMRPAIQVDLTKVRFE